MIRRKKRPGFEHSRRTWTEHTPSDHIDRGGLYHSDTNTLARAAQIHGRYFVTEHGLICFLLRNTCEIRKVVKVAHTVGSENKADDDEVPPLVDVIYDGTGEPVNQLVVGNLEVWTTGAHISDILKREVPMHRLLNARMAIAEDMNYILRMAEQDKVAQDRLEKRLNL